MTSILEDILDDVTGLRNMLFIVIRIRKLNRSVNTLQYYVLTLLIVVDFAVHYYFQEVMIYYNAIVISIRKVTPYFSFAPTLL